MHQNALQVGLHAVLTKDRNLSEALCQYGFFPAQVRGETGQQEFSRHQELLLFKKASCCQSQRLPTCEAMQSSSCCALSSAEAGGCSDASLGAAAPRSQHWPAHLPAIHGLSAPAFLPDTIQPKMCRAKKVPSFYRVYLICFFSFPSHLQPMSLAALLFQGWPRGLRSPPISSLPWGKGKSVISHPAHPQTPSWKLSSKSGPRLLQRAHRS